MTKRFRLENGLLKVCEVAKEAGVKESTVRYYTEVGIINATEKTETGYRLYDREKTVKVLRAIKEINSNCLTLSQLAVKLA